MEDVGVMGQKRRLKCLIIITLFLCIKYIIEYHNIYFNGIYIDDENLDLNIVIATISMVQFLKVRQCYHGYVRDNISY